LSVAIATAETTIHAGPQGQDREPDPARYWALLAPAIAGRARVRVSRDAGRSYPAGCERALTGDLPGAPAAVLLFDHDATARCLAADFDIGRGGREQVDADAAGFAALIAACGGRVFADVSPNGGRHVYVLWCRPRPITELRPLIRALGSLFPSLDPTPMLNPAAGCIRPPGARHRTGGHQQLTTPHHEALAAVSEPNGPQVWTALLERLSPSPAEPETYREVAAELPAASTVTNGGRLSDRVERIARTGVWDPGRYASPSEARQAVVTAAVAAGWALADLATRIETGLWPGLSSLYARYGNRNRRSALARDFRKAHAFLSREKTARNYSTREQAHTGGTRGGHDLQSQNSVGSEVEYRWIRAWWNATRATERIRWTDRAGISKRLVLRALGCMAQRRGSRIVDVGCRSLALACGLDDSTVALVLRALREEPDPVLELLEPGVGERADRYSLRIPDAGLHAAAWRRWRPGPIAAIHPVFRELGAARALVHEALTDTPAPRRDIGHDAALSPGTVDEALRTLAEHGLAERVPQQGWRLGPIHPDRLARTLGLDVLVEAVVTRYRVERAAWRALLERRCLRGAPVLRPDEAIPWPAVALTAPPPAGPDEHAYDQALAGVPDGVEQVAFTAALLLLQREFGAGVLAGAG
jgi:hypothetical protein